MPVTTPAGLSYLTTASIASMIASTTNSNANAVNVGLSVEFTTKAEMGTGSTIELALPTSYPSLSASSPVGVCSVNLAGATCTIGTNKMIVSGYATPLPTGTKVVFSATGIKNPPTSVAYPSAPNGFNLSGLTATGNKVFYADLAVPFGPGILEPVGTTVFAIEPKYKRSRVLTEYDFTYTFAENLFADSEIKFNFPPGYNLLTSGVGCSLLGAQLEFRTCTFTQN
jgi:hypothetical protein